MGVAIDKAKQVVDDWMHAIGRRLLRDLPSPTRTWHGELGEYPSELQMLRIGDCSWQVVRYAHALGEPGYPELLRRRLRDRDVALRFDDYYLALPQHFDPAHLSRTYDTRPDAIVVHLGAIHGALELVPLYCHGLSVVRTRVNGLLGSLGGWTHTRLVAPVLRRFGRPMVGVDPELIDAAFARLAEWIEQTCPGVPWAVLPPNPAIRHGWVDPEPIARATDAYASAAVAHGATFIDYRPHLRAAVAAGRVEDFYGATGYDLLWPGHAIVEQLLHEWLETVGVVGEHDAGPRALAHGSPAAG